MRPSRRSRPQWRVSSLLWMLFRPILVDIHQRSRAWRPWKSHRDRFQKADGAVPTTNHFSSRIDGSTIGSIRILASTIQMGSTSTQKGPMESAGVGVRILTTLTTGIRRRRTGEIFPRAAAEPFRDRSAGAPGCSCSSAFLPGAFGGRQPRKYECGESTTAR